MIEHKLVKSRLKRILRWASDVYRVPLLDTVSIDFETKKGPSFAWATVEPGAGIKGTIFLTPEALETRIEKGEIANWSEYGHIANDLHIGDLCCNSDQQYIDALLTHEVAHVFTYWYDLRTRGFVQTFRRQHPIVTDTKRYTERALWRTHGRVWQDCYRSMRVALVN